LKKLFVKTYGCQMNVYDSARMEETLSQAGYAPAAGSAEADMILLNTCHIRAKAAEKLYSDLGRLAPLKARKEQAGGRLVVAVAGCVAQAEGGEILKRANGVDIVVGPQSYHRLPKLIAEVESGARPVATEFPAESKFDHLPRQRRAEISAFLSVQEGCDRFCSFCVVPYTRGAEFSRPAVDVLDEARRLVEGGARELTLLGQNVNAYHGCEGGLGGLIRALAAIPTLARLRYTTSHPAVMGDGLIAAHRDIPQLMPYLHLPVQSGSDRVLAAMNRRHTVAEYRRVIERLRAARSDMAFSSDFIVGFPGETDADFAATLSLVRATGFAQAFSFKYSSRPGTPAARAAQVPDAVKSARLAELQAALEDSQHRFNAGFAGRTVPVLFDRPGRHAGQLAGRSPWLQAVHAAAPPTLLGRVANVAVTDVHANSLAGELAA
jgi:tRNA-2-methylthio-N6-dimethylallyladenosine synthase